MKINCLKFKNLYSQDLETCNTESNIKINSICKHTNYLDQSEWFLNENKNSNKNLLKAIEHNKNIINCNLSKVMSYDEIKAIDCKINYIESINPQKTWSELASIAFPGKPKFIALITGTDGKTSTAWITYKTWQLLGIKAGYIGTLGIFLHEEKFESNLTTPDSAVLHYYLNEMKKLGIEHVAIEASSIGLERERLAFIKADIAIFTTFTSDHLDYHHNADNYLNAKLKILENISSSKDLFMHTSIKESNNYKEKIESLIKISTNSIESTMQNATNKIHNRYEPKNQYGNGSKFSAFYKNNYWVFNIRNNTYHIQNKLIGNYNGDNMLAAFLIIEKSGFMENEIINTFAKLQPVPGRLSLIDNINNCDIFVDFAHTPDSLKHTLTTLNQHYKKINIVFGCGGDRDKSKRKEMGLIADQLADNVIITNDNPRSEDPQKIADEIKSKCAKAKIILNRREAMRYSIDQLSQNHKHSPDKSKQINKHNSEKSEQTLLKSQEVLLIAGKGEETTQTFHDRIEEFHDQSVINEIITLKNQKL
ncbi:Mur ligase family protein [Candidatus Cytomitobacter primus]|uniref:UDP-N-acetylmuramoyl-L-alanyl-D-glutamate--2, 6-diaminopimelate ligase n=1 Tax=Candidatus Cytomitobacter primus TaxID=2066024 RepID=A0A5C0UFP9_9PROT|nr:UDP-N-acetylmuramoyl-L-alanyl-D-glutamate--2,6-diaminopimelate ligase [Candidatus Cytomitobacter primus]QEK38619.1 UDP-N-acetylmuramoyl-L-alanyl-D-glutamate--2,6-diaminopimelate ligase [Candidatus Cytomitobacter primus]